MSGANRAPARAFRPGAHLAAVRAKLPGMDLAADLAFRQRVFDALALVVAEQGVVTRDQLSAFPVNGSTHRLIDQSRGIWNPRHLAATLSVVSSPDGPYADSAIEGGRFRYDYRAGSVEGDNTKLRRAYELGLPIILLRKIDNGVYVPVFPVYVIGDDTRARQFTLAVDESLRFLTRPGQTSVAERHYAERIARFRLHQAEFRGRVLRAYATRCAVCSLRHGRLLDAAHIIGDRLEGGEPVVQNGLSLCKIHHAAFDGNLLGVSPDYSVGINAELLAEVDGPMLRHGLQEMHGRVLVLPDRRREWPDRARLATRWAEFGEVG
ncbi:HNH endonuclease [soil metagenome]